MLTIQANTILYKNYGGVHLLDNSDAGRLDLFNEHLTAESIPAWATGSPKHITILGLTYTLRFYIPLKYRYGRIQYFENGVCVENVTIPKNRSFILLLKANKESASYSITYGDMHDQKA